MHHLPTYSGVPKISRTSCTASTCRDRPKSTMRMSPKGLLQVSRMFWGYRGRKDSELE